MEGVDPRLVEIFFEVQRGLPRQGPGDDESTSKALAFCCELPDTPDILDIGCGPGMQTLALAKATSGKIVAIDTCEEYLDQLRERAHGENLLDRMDIRKADMARLPFDKRSFDLIWCEGAAYNIGIRRALESWHPLLRGGGYLVFSELIWLEENPPNDAASFFAAEYPGMTTAECIKEQIQQAGYVALADFTIPFSAWWDNYYTPLTAKLPGLEKKYRGDDEALSVIEMTKKEIDIRRRFAHSYGYQFFIARKP